VVRYRFDRFTLSPGRRLLLQDGQEVPLIPKYFDLLVLLIERRHEAVHRREIFDRVWSDSIVSDSALSQAIRTIRRALGDDSKEPRFIRTVSRHGYRFVCDDVVEEREESGAAGPGTSTGEVERPQRTAAAPDVVVFGAPLWVDAAVGGGLAGVVAGAVGGALLAIAPGSTAPLTIAPVLAVVGGAAGVIGGLGVGSGITFAARRWPSSPLGAIVAGAAVGGSVVGALVQWLVHGALLTLLGIEAPTGGALEGALVGIAAGVGITLMRRQSSHARVVVTMAVLCGMAGLVLALLGRPLVGGTLHAIAQGTHGSGALLAPLGRLIGEPDFGPLSRAVIAFCECACFGAGLAWRLGRALSGRTA
jgi:DNA-binding winged helix-turn-helix (wHTH) protein